MNVVSLYRFLDVRDPEAFRDALHAQCQEQMLLGTMLVAAEGFNGTLAGSRESIRSVMNWLCNYLQIDAPLDARWTEAAQAPFRKMRVKLKTEIVTLGRPDLLPHEKTGEHVDAARWNELLADPNVIVVDTRNHYEVEVGTFPGALDPGSDSFREFPKFAKELAAKSTHRPLAMFCTGGIRCEKATALMIEFGFESVYHLQGGILNYLSEVTADDNQWNGECFVFDSRVAVDRDLAEGGYVQCHACRRPLSIEDTRSPHYREGVACPQCVDEGDADRRARLEERRKQVALAAQRGEMHIGPKASKRNA